MSSPFDLVKRSGILVSPARRSMKGIRSRVCCPYSAPLRIPDSAEFRTNPFPQDSFAFSLFFDLPCTSRIRTKQHPAVHKLHSTCSEGVEERSCSSCCCLLLMLHSPRGRSASLTPRVLLLLADSYAVSDPSHY